MGGVRKHKRYSQSALKRERKRIVKAKCQRLRLCHALDLGRDLILDMICSIEFDRDNEYFATAGVTKRIKLYEYRAVLAQSAVEVHPPVKEMLCHSKISCLSWNPYIKERIASSGWLRMTLSCLAPNILAPVIFRLDSMLSFARSFLLLPMHPGMHLIL